MKIARKLLVFDVDGTLLSDAQAILPENLAQIRRMVAAGHVAAIATGRAYDHALAVARQLGDKTVVLANNGAVTAQLATGKYKVNAVLSPEIVAFALQTARKYGVELRWSAGLESHCVFFGNDLSQAIIEPPSPIPGAKRNVHEKWDEVRHSLDGQVQQATLVGRADIIAQAFEEAHEKAGKTCDVLHSIPTMVDFNATGINKWAGVVEAQRELDIPNERTYAFGDSLNDLLMVQNAGFGIAMGNGNERVKKVAKRIIGNNNEPAIAAFLAEINEGE